MRTLIAGGGTGGHLTPALAVAQALRHADPEGDVLLVGRRGGVAERLVTGAGLRLETLDVSGVDASSPLSIGRAAARLPAAVITALGLVRRYRPDVVVGTAGYVCVPVIMAARLARVPFVLLEQNAHPGRAIRMLSRRAHVVASSYTETERHLPGVRVVETGNPVRPEVSRGAPAPLRDRCGHILVMGGSQGARRINDALAGCIRDLLEEFPELTVTHQCGALDAEWAVPAAAGLAEGLRERYRVSPFIDDVAAALREADLVVMRAGGSSLAECSALGRPMILVPYPHAGAHQADNAAPYVTAGAAVLIDDAQCTPERLESELEAVLADTARWRAMAAASAAAGRPDATTRVVELVREVAGG
ncbi:MAG: undecaprenyldiphospho-muramoylpentapeptide beta-N-acetylglucosaminyltransferase [Candidatus Dormibacteria bacterium]